MTTGIFVAAGIAFALGVLALLVATLAVKRPSNGAEGVDQVIGGCMFYAIALSCLGLSSILAVVGLVLRFTGSG